MGIDETKDSAVLTPYGVDARYPGDQPEPTFAGAEVGCLRQVRQPARPARHAGTFGGSRR